MKERFWGVGPARQIIQRTSITNEKFLFIIIEVEIFDLLSKVIKGLLATFLSAFIFALRNELRVYNVHGVGDRDHVVRELALQNMA